MSIDYSEKYIENQIFNKKLLLQYGITITSNKKELGIDLFGRDKKNTLCLIEIKRDNFGTPELRQLEKYRLFFNDILYIKKIRHVVISEKKCRNMNFPKYIKFIDYKIKNGEVIL